MVGISGDMGLPPKGQRLDTNESLLIPTFEHTPQNRKYIDVNQLRDNKHLDKVNTEVD
jgi:hypothetical protein